MKIVIGSDSIGYPYNYFITQDLLKRNHYVADVGTHSDLHVDYTDIVSSVAKNIIKGEFDRAILLSGTGIDMALIANKINGLYAAVCQDIRTIHELAIVNNCNVLCLGVKHIDSITAVNIIENWLTLNCNLKG